MGFFKTIFKLLFLIIVLVIGAQVCTYALNDMETLEQTKSTGEPEYSYPTGVEGETTIFHKQENIHPGYYWAVNVEMKNKEKIYVNYTCHSPIETMWIDNWNFQRFREGKQYEYYPMNPNGSNGWSYLQADGLGTWYVVFNNNTDHMQTVNIEIKK